MNLDNIFYRIKSFISPFKSAIVAVVIAVTASMMVSAVSSAGRQIINAEMDAVGMNGLAVTSYSNKGENTTDYNLVRLLQFTEDTDIITPVIIERCVVTFSNNIYADTMGWGINNRADRVVSLKITEGRMFTNSEISDKSRVCLVDEELAKTAYQRSNLCGKKLTVTSNGKNEIFTIIGTVKKGSNILNTLSGDIVPHFIYIPYTVMEDISSKTGFDQIVFISENTDQTQQQLKDKLVKSDDRFAEQNIVLTNLAQQKNQLENISDTAFTALFAVSCIAVLVCSMSVGSSVNTAVISRQKDIGIKMSLGAGRLSITAEFMSAAVFSCFLGIMISLAILIPFVVVFRFVLDIQLDIDYTLMVVCIFGTIILTAVFSFLPACRAAKMPPIKALNREQQ